jgi:hypothetical protein
MPPSFRIHHADGTTSVLGLDDFVSRLHPHTDPVETLVALSFEKDVQVRMLGNLVATVSLYRADDDDLPLFTPRPEQYTARVDVTLTATTDLLIDGVTSGEEACEVIDAWQGGSREAHERVTVDVHQLVESLRDAVHDMTTRGSFGSVAQIDVTDVARSRYPALVPPA